MYPPWNAATQKRVAVTLARAPARISSICATLSFTSAFVAEPVFEQRLADGPPDDRSGLEQPSRVRVRWMVEHIIHVAGFQQTPGIHDRHLVGDLRDHAEIMGDEQHGKPYSSFSDISRSRICACIVTSSRWSVR